MLVTLNRVLEYAEAHGQAIGAFNVCTLEHLEAVLAAAEESKQPVIIQFVEVHEPYMSLDVMGPIMVMMAEKASVPVCVHMDHGQNIEYIHRGLEIGFSSVMYDGSMLPLEQNIANTKMVVEMAEAYDVSVEAELGAMGGNGTTNASNYTDPDEAQKYVEATGIDALACSFGTIHGLYISEPKLDFDLISEIRKKTGVPIVMHGGSGVSPEDFRECIKRGVRKINYYTYAAKAGGAAVKKLVNEAGDGNVFYHDVAVAGRAAIKEDIMSAIAVFSGQ